MTKISKTNINNKVKFWDIIDPNVSWEFLWYICKYFKREAWLDGLSS